MSAVQSRPTARFKSQFPPGCFSKKGPKLYATSRNTVHFTFCHFSSFHGSSLPGVATSGLGTRSAMRSSASLPSSSTTRSAIAAPPSAIDRATVTLALVHAVFTLILVARVVIARARRPASGRR